MLLSVFVSSLGLHVLCFLRLLGIIGFIRNQTVKYHLCIDVVIRMIYVVHAGDMLMFMLM